MIDLLFDPQAWISLLTLSTLEIVLGIDNLIFISVMASRLPAHQQDKARKWGLALALITRIGLLTSIAWLSTLTNPLLFDFSARDLVLIIGGVFLIAKGTMEIHHSLEGEEDTDRKPKISGFISVIIQIMILDIVFSLDSVITAVGMSQYLPIMITAVIIAVLVMLFASGPVSRFIDKHPTVKMLALSFLLMVGLALVADGFHVHIPKGYLYFAIAFSVLVEALNIFAAGKRKHKQVKLNPHMTLKE